MKNIAEFTKGQENALLNVHREFEMLDENIINCFANIKNGNLEFVK